MAKAIVDVKSISESPTGLDLWNRLEFTDPAFTKPVSRPGGFKGTAVDPVFNLKRVTEQLGPVGFAWGWKVLNERLDTFGAGEDAVTIHSLTVRAWFAQDDGSIREVDHIGHTKASHWTRSTPRRFDVDEEFGKKSLTDALSKIMMSLGASADIWLGRFDGNKYVSPDDVDQPAKPQRQQPAAGKPAAVKGTPQQEVEHALAQQRQRNEQAVAVTSPVDMSVYSGDPGNDRQTLGTFLKGGDWLACFAKLLDDTEPASKPYVIEANWMTLRVLAKQFPKPFEKVMAEAMAYAPDHLLSVAA